MAAQAIPSYAPHAGAAHFNKLECFCFNQYTLAAGREEAVAGLVRDRSQAVQGRDTITLSYTFFEVGGKTPAAPSPTARPPCWRPPEQAHEPAAQRCAPQRVPAAHRACGGLVVPRHPQEERSAGRHAKRVSPLHLIVTGIRRGHLFVLGLVPW
jgi:hypothetical protein